MTRYTITLSNEKVSAIEADSVDIYDGNVKFFRNGPVEIQRDPYDGLEHEVFPRKLVAAFTKWESVVAQD